MGRTIDQKLAELPRARREKIAARATELIAEELSLQDLRKALDLTQTKIAQCLGVRQDTVSRYERRTDMLLSTLQDYVHAMGGELTLVAEFPNRQPVKIRTLGELSNGNRRPAARMSGRPVRSVGKRTGTHR